MGDVIDDELNDWLAEYWDPDLTVAGAGRQAGLLAVQTSAGRVAQS